MLSWSCAGHLSCNEWRVWRKGSNSGWSQTLSFLIYEICAYLVNLIWHFKKFLHVYIVCYKRNIFPLFKFLLNSSFSVVVIFTNLPENTQSPLTQLTFSPFCSGLRDLPSPPCEGDRNQRWSDFGSVVLFLFLSFSPFIFPFFLLLAPRSDGSEPPPPSLSFPTFRFTAHLIQFGLVWGRFAGGFGWLESPSASLSFVGTNLPFQWAPRPFTAVDVQWTSSLGTSSSPSFYRPFLWG